MKISLVSGTLVIFLIATIYLVSNSDIDATWKHEGVEYQSSRSNAEVAQGEFEILQNAKAQMKETSERNRHDEMKTKFATLAQGRRELKSQANFLKSKIWGQKLPSEQAMTINKSMRHVYSYLHNPPLLGAYFETDEIKNEIKKVERMQEDLKQIELIITTSQNNED